MNKHSVFTTIGAQGHANRSRQREDYYATEPKATYFLCNLEKFSSNVWEPACGEGHISKVLEEHGYNVKSSDIINRGYGEVYDFLTIENMYYDGDIITNPPYKYAQEFVEKALSIIPEGHKVAMLLKITFLEGKARKQLFRSQPIKTLYVSRSRIECGKNGVFKGGSAVCYCWFVWEKGYKGESIIKWFN